MLRRSVFLVVLPGLFPLVLFSQNISELISKAGKPGDWDGHDQVVIFDSTLVDMQESGLTHMVNRTLTLVVTPKGARDLSVIRYGYDPLSAYVEIRKAVIYKNPVKL